MTLNWTSWVATDVGTVRAGNEDTYVNLPDLRLWAVADGAGGLDHGEVASGALKAALEAPLDVAGAALVAEMRTRVAAVHAALCQRAEEESASNGTAVTIASTIVVFLADGEYFACLWCGDSRAYLLRAGVLTQLTKDHSFVQELVDAGMLAAEDAERHPRANVLTRAVGVADAPPELDKITGRAQPGDRFLLCSDGLFKALDAAAIAPLIAGDDPARALIAAALAARATDNVTALVIMPTAAPAAPPDNDDDEPTIQIRPAGASA